ncbi:hypothetical protein TNCV_3903791 [Trichonephila clavipes]|nr:hypothetical protein TNCV_3903791 [Trichonephila clavipes]
MPYHNRDEAPKKFSCSLAGSFCFGAIVSFVASLAFETPRCHFAVLARMVEVIAIKALGSARSPTKRDDLHSE